MEPNDLGNNFEFEIEETWIPKLDNECQIGIAGSEHVKALEEELAGVKGDRDAQAKKALEAREEAELTMQQLHQVQKERSAGAERMKALEEELAGVKNDRDAQAKKALEAREEAEFTLLQLHQVQKERALEQSVKALEEELAGVKGDRDAQAKKALEVREEAEFTLLQLHQVQEELEDYFCLSRKKDKLLEKYKVQQHRAKEMLSICLSKSTAKLADHL